MRLLPNAESPEELDNIRKHAPTGRPLVSKDLVSQLGQGLGGDLMPKKLERKLKRWGGVHILIYCS
jgi:hypothetical protein